MLTDILAAILAILFLGGGGWYLFALLHYLRSGQYEVDKRFQELTR